MIKERVTHCNFCGLVIEQAGEDCPLCHYPLDPELDFIHIRLQKRASG